MNDEFYSLGVLLWIEYVNARAHGKDTLAQDLFVAMYGLGNEENQ